ncbi:MaoC family dehydratase [Salinadaptatus halalkaliphilus]|uniref:MaoC family dehydratase n=1 Tax=Salinadaptatus halalkaliphilus TaxID=2419781 RepID=A0A4S3TRQ8_9EURY|nr:MaoC family dehydratase [Salinadaptatus halalkaliphilus]THE66025.1 MaoC family dehydratase [Salinadaptatus halalkaliphilus]
MSSNRSDSEAAVSSPTGWSTVSKHALNSYREANNAVLAAMGLSTASSDETPSHGDESTTDGEGSICVRDDDRSVTDQITLESTTGTDPAVAEVAFGDETWLLKRSTDANDDLGVGDYVHFTKPITDTDVAAFAQISGDTNRLHLEPAFAADTQFDGRIAHGTLVAGTISAALARFPGLTVYLSQDLEFHAPVEIGDVVTADCEIVEELGGDRYRLQTTVRNEDETTVIDGEAVVVIQPSPTDDRPSP